MRMLTGLLALTLTLGLASIASASSHREAPAIAEDQYADNTDVYTFISPESSDHLVVIANYIPLLAPASGPNFYRWSDNVLYEIRIDNDGDAIADLSYEFRFQTTVANPNTFLYTTGAVTTLTDTDLNVRQTYTVRRRDLATRAVTTVFTGVAAAPWDVGRRSFPDYDAVASMAMHSDGSGADRIRVFAGPRQEAFAVDFNVFDLIGVAGPATADYALSYNVMSLVLEVPIAGTRGIADAGVRQPATGGDAMRATAGVYATASRRQVRILRRRVDRRPADHHGQWVQVSRLAIPLVNEVLIPLANKDDYNRSDPDDDATLYGATILNPELNPILGTPDLIATGIDLPCIDTAPADDAVQTTLLALVTGQLVSAGATALAPGDLLRVNIRMGSTFTTASALGIPGFPNGRQLNDDVFTAEVNVLCTGSATSPIPITPAAPGGFRWFAPRTVADPDGEPGTISGPPPMGVSSTFPYIGPPIRPN